MKKNQVLMGVGKLSLKFRKSFLFTFSLIILSSSFHKAVAAYYLTELKIEDDNGVYWDRLMLLMDSTRSDVKENYDAAKFANPEVNFYTFSSDNYKLSIDARPFADGKVIKAGLTTPYKKQYYVRVVQLGLGEDMCLCLRDNYKDTTVMLSAGLKYYFTVNNDSLSYGDTRFEFRCTKKTATPPPPISITLSGNQLSTSSSTSNNNTIIYKGYGSQSVSLTATVAGGKPGYTYSWSPTTGVDSPAAASVILTPQVTTTYTLTVKDANDSIKTISKTITVSDVSCGINADKVSVCHSGVTKCVDANQVQNYLDQGAYIGACLSINANLSNVTCYGASNGLVETIVTGAVPPYTYSWTNNSANQKIDGLTAGTYTVVVNSLDGHSASRTFTVTQPDSLIINTSLVSDVSCYGYSNGKITVSAEGGTSPYSYMWNDGNTNRQRTGLSAGNYSVTVTDYNGCSATQTYQIDQPGAINATVTVSPLYTVQGQDSVTIYRGYGPQSVTLSANVTGGNGGYTYNWSPGSRVDNADSLTTTATPTISTMYRLKVTDANGCSQRFDARIYVVNAKCGNNNHPKVKLCYNGNSHCVNQSAVDNYLSQGATLGSCNSGNKGELIEDEENAGIDELVEDITVYPNPSTGIFNVKLATEVTGGEVNVMDMNGRNISHSSFSAGANISVDISAAPKGIYMMMVKNGIDTYRIRVALVN